MNETVDNYCERLGSQFWAEPANAATNLAFIIAALLLLYSRPRTGADLFLSIWIGVIGIGSFLFHTFATRWAGAADSLPILVFILVYFYLALRHYLMLGVRAGLAATIAYVPASILLSYLIGPFAGSSSGYVGALLAILGVGVLMTWRDGKTARGLLVTGAIFAVSIAFRMADEPFCGTWPAGTHFVWHVLNAVVLYRLVNIYRGHLVRRATGQRDGGESHAPDGHDVPGISGTVGTPLPISPGQLRPEAVTGVGLSRKAGGLRRPEVLVCGLRPDARSDRKGGRRCAPFQCCNFWRHVRVSLPAAVFESGCSMSRMLEVGARMGTFKLTIGHVRTQSPAACPPACSGYFAVHTAYCVDWTNRLCKPTGQNRSRQRMWLVRARQSVRKSL